MTDLVLSPLHKTWIFDLDGTILEHNGYLSDGDVLLPGVKEFFDQINENDYILIVTSRNTVYRNITENFLQKNNIRYNKIIFGIPAGERLLFNDIKVSGLKTAIAVNNKRNQGLAEVNIVIDNSL